MMTDVAVGQMQPADQASDFNAISFMIQQALARTRTAVLVKIVAVHNQGGVEPVGFVDVQPLVNMIDGANVATEHGTIFNIPYVRLQGGRNAIIIDPAVNDIGLMAISDRDISSVKESRKVSSPGSFRRFDLADGIYIGGALNAVPEQYVRFFGNEIEVLAIDKITWRAPLTEIDGDANVTGDVVIDGNLDVGEDAEIAGSLGVGGSAVIDGNVQIGSDLAVSGSGVIDGSLNVGGPLSIGSGAQISRITSGSVTIIANPALGSGVTAGPFTGTCSGAQVGDRVAYSHSVAPGVLIYNVWVSAPDTVSVIVFNAFSLPISLPGETMNVVCFGV